MAITERQKRFALTSGAGVLLTGVVLLLVNILASWVPLRWDLTRSHAYSLSPSSRKLVRGLDEPVVIKVYFSPNLPSPYNSYARYVKDLLAEYRAASHGKVRAEFMSTQPVSAFEQRAGEAGLAPLQFEEMGSNQLQIKRGFMGLTMFYRDRTETLPVIKGLDNLEYDLTTRIARMARKNKKKIGLIIGHGETDWRSSQLKLAQDLPMFYDFDTINLPLSTTAPIQADALLIVGPQQRYDDKSLFAVDQAIMQGIPVAFLLDAKKFMAAQFYAAPQTTGLEALLKSYGAGVSDRLVYDAQCASVGMTQNLGGFAFTTQLRYAYIPMVTAFEKKQPVLNGVETVGLPFVTRLDTVPTPPGVRVTPLLYSSEQSWIAPENTYNVAPNAVPRPKLGEPHGPFPLGALLEGTFPSYFAGKEPPVKGAAVIPLSPKTSIFVLPTSHVLDPNLPEFTGSATLVTNALAYLAHDETLIGIQSKGDIIRPLKPVSPIGAQFVKFLCTLGVPLLPILVGLIRWRRRTTWRKTISAGFAPVSSAPAP
jgi:gliding-associated putative ABC transporter substrate-binding component GldG